MASCKGLGCYGTAAALLHVLAVDDSSVDFVIFGILRSSKFHGKDPERPKLGDGYYFKHTRLHAQKKVIAGMKKAIIKGQIMLILFIVLFVLVFLT